MTDNTEREEFEKVWPVPESMYWSEEHRRYWCNSTNPTRTHAHSYNGRWDGWQAGRASGIQHVIATLKPPVEALFAHIESSRDAVIDADLRKDAARYRFIREGRKGTYNYILVYSESSLDREVDKAMIAAIPTISGAKP